MKGKNLEERKIDALKYYITKINENGFDYIDGYQDNESPLRVKCRKCGVERTITGNYLARKNRSNKFTCKECEQREREKREQRKRELKRTAIKLKDIEFTQNETIVMTCKECGNTFFLYEKRGATLYCTTECARRYANRTHWENRRAKVKNALVDNDISLERLIKRDNNVCYLCGKECNCNDYVMQGDTFIAGNYYPSIDHVQPLAKGGLHSWNNVRLAHRICNTIKSDGGYISPFIQK